ncbi:biotin--[acetyl-CoA-carboxylase] ligase [Thermosipho atlanticus]|uniref:BirA family transcriptional regulator, biotin operon repressor / biotin-[acetyl-CoA-carboxylase] ligase n=1 Tax=Thermosipho atlanticus DSM 15807 TaxID=1123380 RepID=A0A1M5R8V3_9BACT|nr:biotin--[acetyl-CoA-carboxylase] ligase [Thermosipho atlanticus]SHH22588.1 BirA family transcriptional regulator, biotin operon repressor / biotin-[acetyl-CoA-carboxylase] ligase [Thermosipho atlanticus DSM 15807]
MIGDKIIILEKTNSTNDYLKKNYENFINGTVVVAIEQINGKGRKGRTWYSPKGGLWFSILLKPKKNISPHFFTKLSSITIIKILKKYKVDAQIKWPNDIYVNNKKLAGILTESEYKNSKLLALIVGIGININNEIPNELKDIAVSLSEVIGKNINISNFLNLFLKRFNTYYLKYRKTPHILTRIWKKFLTFKEGDSIKPNKENYIIEKIEDDYIIISNGLKKKKITSIHELEKEEFDD